MKVIMKSTLLNYLQQKLDASKASIAFNEPMYCAKNGYEKELTYLITACKDTGSITPSDLLQFLNNRLSDLKSLKKHLTLDNSIIEVDNSIDAVIQFMTHHRKLKVEHID